MDANYPGSVLFHYAKSRLHFFTSYGDSRGGCPIRRIGWKEGHLITCSWQSCPASTPLAHPRNPSILDPILARKEKTKGRPFYSRTIGTQHPPLFFLFSLYTSSFFLVSLFPFHSPPLFSLLFLRRRPPFHHSKGRLFNRA